jgi:hypothetical protein
VDDIKRVLPPVVVDIVAFQSLMRRCVSCEYVGYGVAMLDWSACTLLGGGDKILTTGNTTSQGSLMATRKDLNIST